VSFVLFVGRIGVFIIAPPPCHLIQGSFDLVKVAHVLGAIFWEKNFLFLINGFVLDKTLSKSFFESKKRKPSPNRKTIIIICSQAVASYISHMPNLSLN
jgi:hypothetical protein